jgi:hypothetical protein
VTATATVTTGGLPTFSCVSTLMCWSIWVTLLSSICVFQKVLVCMEIQGENVSKNPNVLYTDMSLGWDLIMTALETEAE